MARARTDVAVEGFRRMNRRISSLVAGCRTVHAGLMGREPRAAACAHTRVAGNFGVGAGAPVAVFVGAAAQQLSAFQILFLSAAGPPAGSALVVLAPAPAPRAEIATPADA